MGSGISASRLHSKPHVPPVKNPGLEQIISTKMDATVINKEKEIKESIAQVQYKTKRFN